MRPRALRAAWQGGVARRLPGHPACCGFLAAQPPMPGSTWVCGHGRSLAPGATTVSDPSHAPLTVP